MELTNELIEKAKACETVEELIALAKENDFELSPEEAELYIQDFIEGEATDEELNNVAGGQEGCAEPPRQHKMVYWEKKEDVQFIFKEGDIVEAFPFGYNHHTATCKVVSRGIEHVEDRGYYDIYWLEKQPGVRTPFIKSWNKRCDIEMK